MITAPRIEEQVLTYVQGPALHSVFAVAENAPIAGRRKFALPDGRQTTVFPVMRGGKLAGVALEESGKGYGGPIGVLVGFNVADDTLAGIGITTLKETPGLGMRVVEPGFTAQFAGFTTPVGLKANGGKVDAVSGATISSTGAVEAVNRAARTYAALKPEILRAWGGK
jgi:electron transport complex protein RnfG